jgi:beta-lactamase regulating signal transducer with metallopeptidase domain
VVLLPRRVLDLTSQVQRAILCHELIHVRRRDWIHTLSEELWCAVLWFHPAARWLASRLCLARETLVDQEAIAHTCDRRAYAEALLAFSHPQPRLVAVTALVRRGHFAERIALIAQEVTMSRRRIVYAFGFAAAVVSLATVATIAQFPTLDDKYGLDQQAIVAAKQWKFEPGKKDGKPVAVEVAIELTFTLR